MVWKWFSGRKNKISNETAQDSKIVGEPVKEILQEEQQEENKQQEEQEEQEEENEMGKIVIISHQNANEFNWKSMKKEIEFMFIRTQYGASNEDTMHEKFEQDCENAGIAFGQFAVGLFSSEDAAVIEAETFLKKIHNQAQRLVLRVEEDTLSACVPKTIVKASQSFIDVCKKKGYRTGLFIPSTFYDLFDFDQIKADFVIVSQFTESEPTVKYDAWHYTNNGEISSYEGIVGLAETTTAFTPSMDVKLKRKRKEK